MTEKHPLEMMQEIMKKMVDGMALGDEQSAKTAAFLVATVVDALALSGQINRAALLKQLKILKASLDRNAMTEDSRLMVAPLGQIIRHLERPLPVATGP